MGSIIFPSFSCGSSHNSMLKCFINIYDKYKEIKEGSISMDDIDGGILLFPPPSRPRIYSVGYIVRKGFI